MVAVPSDTPHEIARYPLSPLAEGMIFTALHEPSADFDLEQAVFRVAGPLDCDRLRDAWQTVSDRHGVLRSSVAWDGDRPRHVVWSRVRVPFEIEDRSEREAGDRERAIAERATEARAAGIAPWTAPLQRVCVLRFGPSDHAIVWTNHHAILDGRSRRIVLNEIVECYRGRPLRAMSVPYAAHIAWLEAAGTATAEPVWRAYLAGFRAPTPLPVSTRPYGTSAGPRAIASGSLDRSTVAALARLAAAYGTTLGVLVQAAWAIVLARHAGERDVVFGAVRAARHSSVSGAAEMVGLLINTLPVRVDVDETQPLAAWLAHVHRQWTALAPVEQTPLRAVVAWSEIDAPARLFDSLVVYERETLSSVAARIFARTGELRLTASANAGRPNVPLVLAAAGSDVLTLRVQADPERYTTADAQRLLGHVSEVLRTFPACASGNVRDVSMLGARERAAVLGTFNSVSEIPAETTVWATFCARARATPDAIALQRGTHTMDYRTLARDAERIADHLQAAGIGTGDFVGVCVERSFGMVAALLGILAAGAASIALDATHPPQRIAFMIGDGRVRTILTHAHLASALAPVLALDAAAGARIRIVEELLAATPARAFDRPLVRGGDPAHVMYTSGSTGMPKGAVLPHRAIARTVCAASYLRFAPDETFFSFVPLTFDVAILEIWGPLLHGARLVLAPPGLPSLDVLAQAIADGGVTTLWLTTALFEQMVDEAVVRLRGVRQLIVGGDVMSPAHARAALAAIPGVRLLNVYGPTEASVLITAFLIASPPAAPIPLGAPIANAPVYVLDAQQRPVPIGVPGEIYTGGDGVSLGYLNRPDLTAQRFLPDPFALRGPGIMYRTGDLARWRDDGTLDFLGRADAQVKIRGVRIELGEIESTLTDHPAVREAVVVARGDSATGKALVAYLVTRAGETVNDAAIVAFLASRLPSAMIPARVVRLDALPRTATGKFDRGALPACGPLPDGGATAGTGRAPASPAEIMLAAVVADVLGLPGIGADDDFYRFGGDSLRAMQLVARVRDAFGADLTIRDLLAAPNVAALAARLASLARLPAARSPIVTHAASAPGTPVVFLHGDLIGGGAYCRELVRLLDGERPVHLIGPHGVEGGVLPASIATMAAQNVAALRAAGIRGPVRLAGFCNGAIVAYEMARELTRTGVRVECVVLVDAVLADRDRLPLARRFAGAVRHVLEVTQLRPALHRRRIAPLANATWLDAHERVLGRWRSLLTRYRPQPYAGRIVLLWSDDRAADAVRQTHLWRRFAPDAGTGRVPGAHLSAITRHLAQTSRIVVHHLRSE